MTAFVLWLYGLLAISSLIMVIAWGGAARQLATEHGAPWGALRWCKPFVIAGGLTIHAAAMSVACSYRAYDVLANGLVELGSTALVQVPTLAMLASSKIMFVWAGAIEERLRCVRWLWWAFLYALIIWGLSCWTWAAI